MAISGNVRVTELDFSTIRANLVDFLRQQEEFKDYNFAGAGLSVLLDLLSYNTYYNSFYANMLANEMFLDSALVRNSVVSIAKHVGYTPRSYVAATALVDLVLTVEDTSPKFITIPRNTPFVTNTSGSTYTFYTKKNNVVERPAVIPQDTSELYKITDVEIVEGTLTSTTYIADSSNEDQKFIIPIRNVDTTTIQVIVQKSVDEIDQTVYNLADDINIVDRDSTVYFLQEIDGQQYQIYFGDDVIGKKLDDGNVVIIKYIVTNGRIANGIGVTDKPGNRMFAFAGSINNVTSIAVSVARDSAGIAYGAARGGDVIETIDSIKFLAPKIYEAQNRAVTIRDYTAIILEKFPQIESVYLWGGEDNLPPQYGKVFICVKPTAGGFITDNEKQDIIRYMKENCSIVTIIPEITDPEYIYLLIDGTVYYDKDRTVLSSTDIAERVKTKIYEYGDTELDKFNKKFRGSNLSKIIDTVDDSILSNEFTLKMKKIVEITTNEAIRYDIDFSNEIYQNSATNAKNIILSNPSVTSSEFFYKDPSQEYKSIRCRLKDDGNGNLYIVTNTTGVDQKIDVVSKVVRETIVDNGAFVGKVFYSTGRIQLTRFAPDSLVNDVFYITAFPKREELTIVRNQIISIQSADINIKAIPDTNG